MLNKDQRCAHQLWESVHCALQAGHVGPHYSPPSTTSGCVLSWRSSAPTLRQVPRSSPPLGVPQLPRLPTWAFLAKTPH